MSKTAKEILDITSSEYKYGFTTDIKEDRIPDGLNESTVRIISKIKEEPKWLLDWRLKAFKTWERWKNLNGQI